MEVVTDVARPSQPRMVPLSSLGMCKREFRMLSMRFVYVLTHRGKSRDADWATLPVRSILKAHNGIPACCRCGQIGLFRVSKCFRKGESMNFFQAIVLGIVQALTEYLPVSSSAHIRIVGELMLHNDPGAAFTAIIQLGTELAVILYFRHDIIRILSHWFSCLFGHNGTDWRDRLGRGDQDATFGWYIIIGTMPILIVGLLFQHTIESTLRNLWITVTVLLLFGVILWWVDSRFPQKKTIKEMNAKEALLYGVGQMLALIPGVSRSGGTITFGRAMGYTRESAVRVSFIMAIPAVFGSGLLEAFKAFTDYKSDPMFPGWGATIAATLVSFFVGYIVIIGFLKFVSTFSYKVFAVYRIALAVLVAVLLLAGIIPAAPSAAQSLGV